jgi:mannosyltransferase OCH1-like enzyme/Tfp pilus assembly protein PilF
MVALGHLARRRGDRITALRQFRSATAADPTNLDLRLDLAAEMREQGDFDGAMGVIQSVLNTNMDHWAAWMQLGQLYRAKNDRQKAMQAFQTAVAKQPLQTQGLVELAQENWASGFPNEAEQLLQSALAQEDSHFGALIVSAEFALQAERPHEALQFARRAIQLHPGQLGSYLIAARAATDILHRKEALHFLDQAREIFGSLPEIAAAHIHILRTYRDFNAARAAVANTIEQAKTSFSLWMESTSFAIAVGDFELAERALSSAPANSRRELANVHFLRANIAEGRRQYTQAIASYKEALALDPRNGDWHSEMARACLLLADINGVRAHLKTAFNIDKAKKVVAGQSLNISQHHTGQLLDEFVMDPALLAKLNQACKLPAEKKLDALRQLVRDNPDHTAPALLLVLAMRQSGVFSLGQINFPSDATPRIPRTIVQFWDTEVPPDEISELIASWCANHNDYAHLLFNDESADKFLGAHYPHEVRLAFRRTQQRAQRADIFCLAYLASEGGYYIDVGDLCLARLDTFVPAYVEIVGYQENYATIANNFIGAAPRHPVIVRALQLAVEAVNRGDRDIIWLSTGPGLLTRAFAQIAAETRWGNWLSKAAVLELWEAQRLIGIHCPTAYKNTDQHGSRAVFRRQATNRAVSSFVAKP